MLTNRRPLGHHARRDPRRLPTNMPLPPALRAGTEGAVSLTSGDPLERDPPLALLEGLLLVADEPLPPRRLAQAAGLADATKVRRLLRKLQSLYEREGTAFQIEELAGGFQLLTRPEYHRWLASHRRGST